jgi:hypothetical protein
VAGTTPIVIVIAHRTEEFADYQDRGYTAVLGKPSDLDQLYETARRALG